MREDLMQELRRVTEEEERLLAGGRWTKACILQAARF